MAGCSPFLVDKLKGKGNIYPCRNRSSLLYTRLKPNFVDLVLHRLKQDGMDALGNLVGYVISFLANQNAELQIPGYTCVSGQGGIANLSHDFMKVECLGFLIIGGYFYIFEYVDFLLIQFFYVFIVAGRAALLEARPCVSLQNQALPKKRTCNNGQEDEDDQAHIYERRQRIGWAAVIV